MCRDRVTDILFADVGDDQSLPICILEALLKVRRRKSIADDVIFIRKQNCIIC